MAEKVEYESTKPAIRGPFRGVIISFKQETNFTEVKEIFAELTFHNPNHYCSELDKCKAIIYFKNPYDVAMVIDKHQSNVNFDITIFNDKLTRTLRHDVLHIKSRPTNKLLKFLEQLNGEFLYNTRISMLVKFENFKQAAIASEELRKLYVVKFAYKDHFENRDLTNVQNLLKKVKGLTPDMKENFKKEFEKVCREDKTKIQKKIEKTSENLELANVSCMEHTKENQLEESDEENQDWNSLFNSYKRKVAERNKTAVLK